MYFIINVPKLSWIDLKNWSDWSDLQPDSSQNVCKEKKEIYRETINKSVLARNEIRSRETYCKRRVRVMSASNERRDENI